MPLLKARCVKCHGPAKREGKLSLATPKGMARGGKHGELIVPGRPDDLWQPVAGPFAARGRFDALTRPRRAQVWLTLHRASVLGVAAALAGWWWLRRNAYPGDAASSRR